MREHTSTVILFIFIAAVLSLSAPAVGQVKRGAPFSNRPEFDLGELSRDLHLTSVQQASIAVAIEAEKSQAGVLWQKEAAKIQSVLGFKQTMPWGTPSWNDKFVPGVSSAPRVRSAQWVGLLLDQLARNLNLTKDQQAKIQPVIVDLQRGLLEVHERATAQISKGLDRDQRDRFKDLAGAYDPPFYIEGDSRFPGPDFFSPLPQGTSKIYPDAPPRQTPIPTGVAAGSPGGFDLDTLRGELNLNGAQQASIDPFIEAEKSQAVAIWRKADMQIQNIFSSQTPQSGLNPGRPIGVGHFGPFGIGGTPSVRSQKWVGYISDQLAKNLSVTKDQQAKIQSTLVDLQRGLLDLHKKTTDRISNVLDREQRDRFKDLADAYDPPFYNPRMEGEQNVPDGRQPGAVDVTSEPGYAGDWLGTDSRSLTKGNFWRFVLQLKLTDGQKAQIKPLFSDQQQKGMKIERDASLSARDRQSQIDDLNRVIHANVLSKLTPAQRNQLRSMPGFRP